MSYLELEYLAQRPASFTAGTTEESAGVYKDAGGLVFTPRAQGTNLWIISFHALVRNTATFGVWSQLSVDGVPYSEGFDEDGGDWLHSDGGALVPLDKSEHTICVQVKTSSVAQPAAAKAVLILARLINP